MTRHSQNDEQEIILAYFGDFVGDFLDVGAYNGRTLSNTLALAERGWSGVCVEPSPRPFADLVKLHADRTGIDLVQAAVAAKAEWAPFMDSGGDAVSTLDMPHKEKWESQCKFQRFYLHTVTVGQLLEGFGYEFNFLSLDVEGTNWEILQLFPLERLTALRLICVEHDGRAEEMADWAAPHGFRQISFNAENVLLAK